MRIGNLLRGLGIGFAALNLSLASGCDRKGGSGNEGGSTHASESSGSGTDITANDRAAREFVQSKIDACWVKAADGWTTQWRKRDVFGKPVAGVPDVLFEQYRELNFAVHPEQLSEAQKLNGTTYRAGISFADAAMRRFRTVETIDGPPGWSQWRQDAPANSLAVELRNGTWLISDADMFSGVKPDLKIIPPSK